MKSRNVEIFITTERRFEEKSKVLEQILKTSREIRLMTNEKSAETSDSADFRS